MTNPTQPIEHFTLEQVEQMAENFSVSFGHLVLQMTELHALINAAINERIGEPVAEAEKIGLGSDGKTIYHVTEIKSLTTITFPVGTKLYTLKELP